MAINIRRIDEYFTDFQMDAGYILDGTENTEQDTNVYIQKAYSALFYMDGKVLTNDHKRVYGTYK